MSGSDSPAYEDREPSPSTDRPMAGGLGDIGVVAMREREEVAGGWLRIESAPGAGTHVEFWIPDTPVPVDEDARPDEAAA